MKLVKTFNYEGQTIEFDLSNKNLMVNATEMARLFDANMGNFTRNEQTKRFIEECLNNANSHYLNIETQEDLIQVNQKTGTWMHRVLALKFAAWLSPAFDLWVYRTIDELLLTHARKIEMANRQRAEIKKRILEIEMELRNETQVFAELEVLRLRDRQMSYQLNKENANQINLFLDSEAN